MLGIKGTGESSFSTESLFAFFAEGFFVEDPFNLRFCANDSSETGFGAFFADFLGFDEDVDDDDSINTASSVEDCINRGCIIIIII